MTRSHEATELKLYIDNDGDLHRSQGAPILKNLATKKARGEYKHDLAVKMFGYLVESGAKKYAKEFGGSTSTWHKMFDVPTRRQVAEAMTNDFESEANLGGYDSLLPKKYQAEGTPAGKRMKAQTARVAARTSHLPRKKGTKMRRAPGMPIHLAKTRGGTECGSPGDSSADINWVTCKACLRSHDAMYDRRGEKKSSAQIQREIDHHLGVRR